MSNTSSRAPDIHILTWQLRQLVRSGQYPDEGAALRSALRALFLSSPHVKLKMVLAAYQSGEIGLGKAAAMLGVSQEEMKDIVREAGGEIHLGPTTLDELRGDVGNA